MPVIYLDPSTDETNLFVGGGNEEEYMNQIADAMIPYLRIAGIDFKRNNPEDSQAEVIRQSNLGNYDLHLNLRTYPAEETLLGPIIYYNMFSPEGQQIAYDIARNLWTIYPDPDYVDIMPTSSMEIINRTRALAVAVDLGNNKNPEDADWIRDNIFRIARILVRSLTDFFDIPFDTSRSGQSNQT